MEKVTMKLRFFHLYIFLVLLTAESLSKPFFTGSTTLSGQENFGLADAVEYLKRYGYLLEGNISSSKGDSGTSIFNSKKEFVDSTSIRSVQTTGKTECFEDTQTPKCLVKVMAYTEKDIAKALNSFQKMNGVNRTGVLDKITKDVMRAPRCGVSDHIGIFPVNTRISRKRFSTKDNKRPRRALLKKRLVVNYNIVSSSKKLTLTEVRTTIKKAFRKWAEVIPVVFRRSSSNADIKIAFAEGKHNCSAWPVFVGKGQTLVHIRYPTPQFAGEIHFNDAVDWSTDAEASTAKISLMRVAVHTGGHMLGLRHSSVATSIMYGPYPRDPVVKTELQDNDIHRVQVIFGLCETSFDAIESWMGNGKTYTFKGNQYWRFNDVKRRTEPNYPQPTTLWRGIPANIDEMLLWGHNWGTYFFKDDKYYKYNDYADAVRHISYISRGWPGVPDNIDAAFTHSDLKTYFFKGSLVYQFDNTADRVSTGYPKKISTEFPGVPDYLDTAFRWYHDGKSYFFKGLYFYEWDDSLKRAVGPQKIAQKWQNHCFV